MGAAISIRLPEPLARRLTNLSEVTERPKSFHVQKALENYFEEFAAALRAFVVLQPNRQLIRKVAKLFLDDFDGLLVQ